MSNDDGQNFMIWTPSIRRSSSKLQTAKRAAALTSTSSSPESCRLEADLLPQLGGRCDLEKMTASPASLRTAPTHSHPHHNTTANIANVANISPTTYNPSAPHSNHQHQPCPALNNKRSPASAKKNSNACSSIAMPNSLVQTCECSPRRKSPSMGGIRNTDLRLCSRVARISSSVASRNMRRLGGLRGRRCRLLGWGSMWLL